MNNRSTTITYLRAVQALQARQAQSKIRTYYPDTGPCRRELYPKHMQFFKSGVTHRQRLMLAANRVGKTESVGLYELSCHLTGRYPHWWEGKRFTRPIKAWVCGDTKQTVREILQDKLLGPPGSWGSGVLPGRHLERVTRAGSVADTVETGYVEHASGGLSKFTFKSYDQGRKAFQGTEQDVILMDEEPPLDVYSECLVRTMTNQGIMMLTFTPLLGASDVVLAFLPGGTFLDTVDDDDTKVVITCSWDEVPHLTQADKDELYASIPPFQRDARSKGIPQLGAGAIYPVPESDITVVPFQIPDDWPRSFGFDVGWNRTAAIWGARDLENGIDYLYQEHYRAEAEPVVHAAAIKARGDWIPGVIDPASRGRSQKDGEQLFHNYRTEQGLNLHIAKNGVESGLLEVWQALSTGKLKVFNNLGNWLSEYRLYRRDEKGKVVKQKDHLMDATRYRQVSGRDIAIVKPVPVVDVRENAGGWMG